MIKKKNKLFDSFSIRKLKVRDYKDIYIYSLDDKTMEFLSWKYNSLKESKKGIKKIIKDNKVIFAILDNKKVIGTFGLKYPILDFNYGNINNVCQEIGYVLYSKYWGKNIMSKVLDHIEWLIITKFILSQKSIELFCYIHPQNQNSLNFIKKHGFEKKDNNNLIAKKEGFEIWIKHII